MELKEIQERLRSHQLWLNNDPKGKRADLSGADLSGADLYGAYLSEANLSGANLSRANLSGANLSEANLSGADLYGAYLSRANLSRANLSGAYLSGADLSGAYLYGANLKETLLDGKIVLTFQFEKDTAYFYGFDEITIGCEKHTVSYWLENFKSIGQKHTYSHLQIKKYGKFIKVCAHILKQESK